MDTLAAIWFAAVAGLLLWVVLVGLITRKVNVTEVLRGKRRGKKSGAQATVEGGEGGQMLAGLNEYRRKRGLPEMTAAELGARDRELRKEMAERAGQQRQAQRRSWEPPAS